MIVTNQKDEREEAPKNPFPLEGGLRYALGADFSRLNPVSRSSKL